VKVAAGRPGTADRSDAETLGSDRIDRAVAMARNQALSSPLLVLEERRHEMLTVPHCENDWHFRADAVIDIRWIDTERTRLTHQPQVFGCGNTNALLHPRKVGDMPERNHELPATINGLHAIILEVAPSTKDFARSRQHKVPWRDSSETAKSSLFFCGAKRSDWPRTPLVAMQRFSAIGGRADTAGARSK